MTNDIRLTAGELVRAISELPRNTSYGYVNKATKGRIKIVDILQENIRIKRYNPSKGKALNTAEEESISSAMIWRIANALNSRQPVNVDRVLAGSYNTRSVLESLLAHTPEFYICYPKRIEVIASSSEIKRGHKHIVWIPERPHKSGVIEEINVDMTISEIPGDVVIYDSLSLPDNSLPDNNFDVDVARRHAQMQIALVLIGRQLGFKTWVARNDRAIVYHNQTLGNMEGVIPRLEDMPQVSSWREAMNAAVLIDCIWFRNAKFMPAVIEVEHSTGVTSGLTRMKGLFDSLPSYPTRYVIVAADEERAKVIQEANRYQFLDLNTRFFPYSAVEELYALCQRRKLDSKGINEAFLDYYMEPVVHE